MCRFASMIVTKGFKVFWSKTENSHSVIRAEFGLPENGVGRITSVQIEYLPPAPDVFSKRQIDWNFTIDQDTLPEWWDMEEAKKACWVEIPKICQARGISMVARLPCDTFKVRIPDGYERCPMDHVLRYDIDLGPVSKGGGIGYAYRNSDKKKAYKNFQWVMGWNGDTVSSARSSQSLLHRVFIRPKAK